MTRRLDDTFAQLRARREGAFMPFLVIGDPDLDTSMDLARALVRSGADMLEFGLAFSDPPADGPVIQAGGKRALSAGVNTDHAFEYLAGVRSMTEAPVALLVYYNLIYQQGMTRFYRRARDAGVDAILVADLPIEEAAPAIAAAEAHEIAPIFIVSERTSKDRLRSILHHARGYLYLVARPGVTGQADTVSARLSSVIRGVREETSLPLLAGFGLSTPSHVQGVLDSGADGAISGSAVVAQIAAHLGEPKTMVARVETFAREMKLATQKRFPC